MRKRTTMTLRRWLKDIALGAALFLVLPMLAAPSQSWTIDEAFAGDVIATRAVEVTSPPGPAAENAIVAAAQLRAASVPLHAQRMSDLAVLGLAFSLLVACNLAFVRHLRREGAALKRISDRRSS